MKPVRTALNEEEYKRFMHEAEKLELSEYGLAKKLVTDFLKTRQFLYKQPMGLCFFYILFCYTLIVTAVVSIFL